MNGDTVGEGWLRGCPSLVFMSCQNIMCFLLCANGVRMDDKARRERDETGSKALLANILFKVLWVFETFFLL